VLRSERPSSPGRAGDLSTRDDVVAASGASFVRGLRSSAVDAALDDGRPAAERHPTAPPRRWQAFFRVPRPGVRSGPAIAVTTRFRERSRTFFCDSQDCDPGKIDRSPATSRTGLSSNGSFSSEAGKSRPTASGLHTERARRRRMRSRTDPIEASDVGTGKTGQRGAQRSWVCPRMTGIRRRGREDATNGNRLNPRSPASFGSGRCRVGV
jgi:hypothetical protein